MKHPCAIWKKDLLSLIFDSIMKCVFNEFNRKPLCDVKVHSVIHMWVSEFEWISQMRINCILQYNSSFVIQVSLLEPRTMHYALIHKLEHFNLFDSLEDEKGERISAVDFSLELGTYGKYLLFFI